jgi:hypothetical protein
MTGVCKDAVLKLIEDMGAACAEFHDSAVRGVAVQRVQCDEVWSYCYAKAKNVPEEKKNSGFSRTCAVGEMRAGLVGSWRI